MIEQSSLGLCAWGQDGKRALLTLSSFCVLERKQSYTTEQLYCLICRMPFLVRSHLCPQIQSWQILY